MTTNLENSLLSIWSAALASAGILGVDVLVDSTESADDSSSAEASFRWGDLVLRLVRDRGQDFVDLAPVAVPARAYGLDDVGVAQGWRTIESVLARQEPAALIDELREVVRHRTELERAFAPARITETDAEITAARKRRQTAFLDKLKELAAKDGSNPGYSPATRSPNTPGAPSSRSGGSRQTK